MTSEIYRKSQDINLQQIYLDTKSQFLQWMIDKELSQKYYEDLARRCKRIFSQECNSVLALRDKIFASSSRKYDELTIRNWISFCDDNDLLEPQVITHLRAKIKITRKSKVDDYVPTEQEVDVWKNHIKSYNKLGYISLKILLDSGLRISEVSHFLQTMQASKFEVIEGRFAVYSLHNFRGSKYAFYLFISYDTYRMILENFTELKKYKISGLQKELQKRNILPLKYTRKYRFTQFIKAGMPIEIADYIEGRSSKSVGFNNYLAKKEIAVQEYMKLFKPEIQTTEPSQTEDVLREQNKFLQEQISQLTKIISAKVA